MQQCSHMTPRAMCVYILNTTTNNLLVAVLLTHRRAICLPVEHHTDAALLLAS